MQIYTVQINSNHTQTKYWLGTIHHPIGTGTPPTAHPDAPRLHGQAEVRMLPGYADMRNMQSKDIGQTAGPPEPDRHNQNVPNQSTGLPWAKRAIE